MDPSLILQNLVSPPVLFFFLGVTAVLVGSDLEIPAPIPKLFSLYLLLAIGFKGGLELQHSGLGGQVLPTIAAAMAMSLLVPLYSYLVLKTRLDGFNAAAIAGYSIGHHCGTAAGQIGSPHPASSGAEDGLELGAAGVIFK